METAAPLREIVELKDRFGAWLFVDEAHGVGVIGKQGRGLADELGVSDRVEVQMGTLGKALGSSGAYICGSVALRDYLINRARSFIFSTALPPHCAAAARSAVELLESAEGARLVKMLQKNISAVARGLQAPGESAIFPIILGGEELALSASRSLLREGFLIPAIRYPYGRARRRAIAHNSHGRSRFGTHRAARRDCKFSGNLQVTNHARPRSLRTRGNPRVLDFFQGLGPGSGNY